MKHLSLIMLLLVIGFSTVEGKKRTSHEDFMRMEQLIKSNKFQIDITRVISNRGFDTNRFTISGTINVNDTIYTGHLPFFGRAYRLNPGSDAGITFDGKATKFSHETIETRRKATIIYRFSIPSRDDLLHFYIEVQGNGSCSITLTSNNRETISYLGVVTPLATPKE